MLERSITKALAGLEDLLLGRGEVTQFRAGGSYPVTKISMPLVITDFDDLAALDPDKHPFVILVRPDLKATLYEFVSNSVGYAEVILTNARDKPTAGFYQTGSATTSIITVGVATKVQSTTAPSEILRGFAHTSSGRLVNTSGKTVEVHATASVVIGEENQAELHFWIARSGQLINSSRAIIPAVATPTSRTAVMSAVIAVAPNQSIEIFGANMTDLTNFVTASHSMVVA